MTNDNVLQQLDDADLEIASLKMQLAAEREENQRLGKSLLDEIAKNQQLRKQLDAAVEALTKAKPIVGAAVAASSNESRPLREKVYNLIVAALAKIREGK